MRHVASPPPIMKAPSTQKRLLARLIIFAVLLAAVWFFWHRQQKAFQVNPSPTPSRTEHGTTPAPNPTQAPAYVLEVLQYIRRNGEAPDQFVGGREFLNKEKRLPTKDASNHRIRYSEWDVHPKIKGQNRGPERLITGSDHSAYFSRDHYKTFLKID